MQKGRDFDLLVHIRVHLGEIGLGLLASIMMCKKYEAVKEFSR